MVWNVKMSPDPRWVFVPSVHMRSMGVDELFR